MANNQTKRLTKLKQAGFTIIEVLLFTSLSALFLLIAVLGSGPIQRNTQFTIGMEDVEQIVDDVVSDLQNGVSRNPGNLNCNFNDFGNERGTNENCVLIGKIIDFGQPGSNEYTLYDVIADNNATDFASANMRVLRDTSDSPISITSQYKWGLQYQGSDGTGNFVGDVRMVGIFFDITQDYNTVFLPYAFTSRSLDDDNIGNADPTIYSADDATGGLNLSLCFDDGTTERQASLIFGDLAKSLSAEVAFDTNCMDSAS